MLQFGKGRALNASYSLRRRIVPSKRFQDFYLQRQPSPKQAHLETGERLTWKSGEGSTSSSNQSPLPVSIFRGDTLCCGDNSSALPQLFPGSSLPNKDGCESTCKVSEPTLSTGPEASEHVDQRNEQTESHQVMPCKDVEEQALETSSGPQVIKQCSPEQEKEDSLPAVCLSHREPETSMGSTPQAGGKIAKKKVAPEGNHQKPSDLEQRLEVANILLQLAQQVPNLVPETGCTINIQKQLQLIQQCISKEHQNISGPKKGNSMKPCAHQKVSYDHNGYSKKDHSSKKHGQKRKHLCSLDSGPVKGPEWTASRDREDMFFPHLGDSSLMAEAKERKRRETEQEHSLRQMVEPLEERYIKNAAVLPDIRPLPPVAPSLAQSSSLISARLDEPLLIHGHTMEDYQAIYHSVVDPMLKTKSGSAHQYNLGLGRAIKQRLWERMSCPTLVETVDADGRVHITESFAPPSPQCSAPHIDLDISGEPLPGQPQRKRAKH